MQNGSRKSCLFYIMLMKVLQQSEMYLPPKHEFLSLYTLPFLMYIDLRNKLTCVCSCDELVSLGQILLRTEQGIGNTVMNLVPVH